MMALRFGGTTVSKYGFASTLLAKVAAVSLMALAAGCGWVEVDPSAKKSQSATRAPVRTAPNQPVIRSIPGGREVIVRKGDTVYGIANRYGVTPRQMIALNDLRPPLDIQVGQRLRLPPVQRLHTVRAGDTISRVAAQYRTNPQAIARLNHLPPPYVLHTGEAIGVPIGSSARAVASARPLPRRRVGDQPVQTRALPPPGTAPSKQAAPVMRKALPSARSANPTTAPKVKSKAKSTGTWTPEQASRLPPKRSPALAAPPPPKASKAKKAKPAVAKAAPVKPAARPKVKQANSRPLPRGPALAKSGSSGGFLAPVEGPVIAKFGRQADGRRNDGVNIAAPRGTPVRAAKAGQVVYAGDALQGYGKLLLIKHPGAWVTAYAHLDRIVAKRGDNVARGQTVGVIGTTGGVAAPQLHFEMRKDNKPVNPAGHLSAK